MTAVGELVGRGRTSEVYSYGPGAVVKVPHEGVPTDWIEFEAGLTRAVRSVGVPAPEVLELVSVNNRRSIVFERVYGPSLWEQMLAEPARLAELAADLAAIQRSLFHVDIPSNLPDFVDRLLLKIDGADSLGADGRADATSLVATLPRGAALLHGDLHPGNILMGDSGPVVIDWFDASIGHPVGDIVRSALLIQPARAGQLKHLPGATSSLLDAVHRGYVSGFRHELEAQRDYLGTWQGVLAAGRLAEGAEIDETGLLRLSSGRNDGSVEARLLPEGA